MTKSLSPRFRAMVLLVLVAGLGFVAGVATDRLLLARSARAADARAPRVRVGDAPVPPASGRRLVGIPRPEEIAEELDLTAEQRAELERILAADQAALREVMARVEPSMAAIIEQSRRKIERILTDEQRARWHEFSTRYRPHEPEGQRD